jgi:hypothetical protein
MKNDKDKESGNPARGYLLADFLEPWRWHLDFNVNSLRTLCGLEPYRTKQSPIPTPQPSEIITLVPMRSGFTRANKSAACRE